MAPLPPITRGAGTMDRGGAGSLDVCDAKRAGQSPSTTATTAASPGTPITAEDLDRRPLSASSEPRSEENGASQECRQRWRVAWARRQHHLGHAPADDTYTRWLAPSTRPHSRDKHSGVRNAWMREAWTSEARTRWHSQMPKSRWRTAPLITIVPFDGVCPPADFTGCCGKDGGE
mmetsp:Transcript_84852/g.238824  ORF Transcript_84852/g.238824 Transcript_84852/m.238824 type:complete len:175 (-) Transcript_84852:213-737(-)